MQRDAANRSCIELLGLSIISYLYLFTYVILTFAVKMFSFEVETFHILYGHLHVNVSGPRIVSSLHHFETKDCAPRCGFDITHSALQPKPKPKPLPVSAYNTCLSTHQKIKKIMRNAPNSGTHSKVICRVNLICCAPGLP